MSVADAVTLFSEAVMVVEPAATGVASPAELIVAMAGFEDDQIAEGVMSLVVPSLYVAFAANACVVPTATLAGFGDIAMDFSVGGAGGTAAATVTDAVFAATAPMEAAIVAEPATTPVAFPPALTVTTAGLEDTHVADAVTSEAVPSL